MPWLSRVVLPFDLNTQPYSGTADYVSVHYTDCSSILDEVDKSKAMCV